MEFKIGDRVTVREECKGKNYRGFKLDGGSGNIISISQYDPLPFLVSLDNEISWYYKKSELTILCEEINVGDTVKIIRVNEADGYFDWEPKFDGKVGTIIQRDDKDIKSLSCEIKIDGVITHFYSVHVEKVCVSIDTLKIGDRVRVKQECVGCNCRGDGVDGGYGIITETRGKRWFGVKLDNEEVKYEPSYREDELILLEDAMEYTLNGVTYKQLKDITVKALVLAGADDEYVEYFGMDYNITEQIWLRIAIDFSSRWPEKLQWLVAQGFVEVVEEALKACPFCGGEAHWQTEKRDWIACSDCKIETNVMDSTQEAISLWNKRV